MSDKAASQKTRSPEGCDENGPAAALLLSHVSIQICSLVAPCRRPILIATPLHQSLTWCTSVLSPKYEVFCRRSVGCFSRRSEPDWRRSAHIFVIRVERATRKNSQLAPAQRVAMKMGRRLRCSSVTYRFRYAPSIRQSGSDRLAGGPF